MMDVKELTADKLKLTVQESFTNIRKALDIREKLLLRQIDVLENHTDKIKIDNIKFFDENKNDIINTIRQYGKFNINNINLINNLYKIEDYICPNYDHDLMYKCLNNTNNSNDNNSSNNGNDIIIDITNNKNIINSNCNNINDSIINITINESKELINKTCTLGNGGQQNENIVKIDINTIEEYNDDIIKENSIINDNNNKISSDNDNNNNINNVNNLTINNTNGLINITNISNLTINNLCSNHLDNITLNHVNHIDNNNDDDDYDNNTICGFYNRLINDNILIKNHNDNFYNTISSSIDASINNYNNTNNCNNNNNNSKDINLLLNNTNNENINNDNNHPVQVKQWLKEIINETEIEPIQNNEILEHSIIKKNI